MTRDAVGTVVWTAIHEILPSVTASATNGGRHLRDLGADSVDRIEIILCVLDRLGVDEPMSSFSDMASVDALVDFLVEVSHA